tara:strand:- start:458 stop:1261 length:804 start_codon:yes stop_codon:yes gene_type:complete
MGLLEKAGQIKSEDETKVEPAPVQITPEPVAATPEPVKPKKRAKRQRRERKKREPRQKRTRVAKTLPDGFEAASRGQIMVRRVSDFLASWGWCIPLVVVSAWGSYFDPTYFVLIGLVLIVFNLGFMPSTTGRTVGNWISRTNYVNTKSEKPHQSFHLIKGLTFPMVLIGGIVLLTATSEGLANKSGQILLAVGFIFIFPSFLDYLFYRFKKDDQGLWDTLYGGVWMVRSAKTAEAKGWLKRLEQLGDYSEAQGWWKDKEEEDSEPTE